ncbi:MAG: glycosyltransferase family 2 protein [Myxococcales bacterium]
MPEVSVLLPVFNAASTLPVALESLRRQSLSDWECIACDDGSSDESLSILRQYASSDSRFKVVSASHQGLVATLNRGIAQCAGRFVARFDADDAMHRDRLKLQLGIMIQEPELAGVGCLVRIFPRARLPEGRRAYERWLNGLVDERLIRRDRFVECPLAHPTLFLKYDVLAKLQYRAMHWPEDYDFVLRLIGLGFRLATVPKRLLLWRDSPARLSRTAAEYALEQFTRCKAHFLAKDWIGEGQNYILWGYGRTGKQLARALAQLGKRPCAIVEVHPRRIGQRILDAPVVAASELSKLEPRHEPIIVSVAGEAPRADARRFAEAQGLIEGRDYVCAA